MDDSRLDSHPLPLLKDAARDGSATAPAPPALSHLFGYCLVNDWSARRIQMPEPPPRLPNTRAQGSGRTWFSIAPRRSISTRTRSPTRRNFPSAMPTPAGVPVEITSPGSSVMTVER